MPTGIALTRARDHFGKARLIHVFIDGIPTGEIPYGCREEFWLEPGVYSVWVKMDWNRSVPFRVEVRQGEMIELEGTTRWRGFLKILSVLACFFAPGWLFVVRPSPDALHSSPNQELWEGVRGNIGFLVFISLIGFVLTRIACLFPT